MVVHLSDICSTLLHVFTPCAVRTKIGIPRMLAGPDLFNVLLWSRNQITPGSNPPKLKKSHLISFVIPHMCPERERAPPPFSIQSELAVWASLPFVGIPVPSASHILLPFCHWGTECVTVVEMNDWRWNESSVRCWPKAFCDRIHQNEIETFVCAVLQCFLLFYCQYKETAL